MENIYFLNTICFPRENYFTVIMGSKPQIAAFGPGSKSFEEKGERVRGRGENPAFSKGVFPLPRKILSLLFLR
ncbi:MAG: hypothetical protein AB1921_00445 [Thermodesulfobacteriota bacterium]